MALKIKENKIEIYIPNSEAVVGAQKVGIKDKSVGSYYMSSKNDDIIAFLNGLNANFYVDFAKTMHNMTPVYKYILSNHKKFIFKEELKAQAEAIEQIIENGYHENYTRIRAPEINNNKKYLRFDKSKDKRIGLFQILLLGDLSKLVILKLADDCFMLYGETVDKWKEKID